MPSLRTRFGLRLRSIRRARDLSQERFAELLGISVDFLSLVERGINSPSFDYLEQIANRLHLPVKDLFDFPAAEPSKSSAGQRIASLHPKRPQRPSHAGRR